MLTYLHMILSLFCIWTKLTNICHISSTPNSLAESKMVFEVLISLNLVVIMLKFNYLLIKNYISLISKYITVHKSHYVAQADSKSICLSINNYLLLWNLVINQYTYAISQILPLHLERKFVLLSENSKIWNLSKSSQWGHLGIIRNLVLNKQLFCISDRHGEAPAAKQMSNAYFSPVMRVQAQVQIRCSVLP